MTSPLSALLARPIAHRGLHDRDGGIIENSLEAARAAIKAGYGIECDVQATVDDQAVVFHDETLERLTNRDGRVGDHTAESLASMMLRGGISMIPTLATFLREIEGRTPLIIEIKSRFDGDTRLAKRTVASLAGYAGAVALKSFDPVVVAACRAFGARCPLGLVGPCETMPAAPGDTSCAFLSWNVRELARLPASETRPRMSWTVRSRDDHAEARRHGAQIVFEHYRPALTSL